MSNRERTPHLDHGRPPEGPRLPAATRLGPVRLQVAEPERSVAFYRDVVGFQVQEREGDGTALGVPGATELLLRLVEREGAAPVPPRGHLGLYHFAILLPDRASLGRFATHLARIGARAGASDHRVSEAFYLQDPDGLGVEVYADRPRESWQVEEGQIVMATDPLDVQEVARAGSGEPWEGLPPGTTMGHMHLHVGDLEQAREFYHHGLGLDEVVWSYPGALFLSAGGYHHHLGVNTWAQGAAPAGEDDARLLEWELRLPSEAAVERVAENLEARGHPVEREGTGARTGDPWGTRLRLSSDPDSG